MPEVADSAAASGISRKEKFRQYFRAFNPTVSPSQALQDGFVIDDLRPGLVHKKIAARVELEARSRQAVIGGVGSGKTTELLLASRHLWDQGVSALFIEASQHTDISRAKPGFLIGILCQQLIKLLGSPDLLRADAEKIQQFLYGRWQQVSELPFDLEGPDAVFVGGVAEKPVAPESYLDTVALNSFGRIIHEFRQNRPLALLVDGLDRVQDLCEFQRLILADMAVFRAHEIPVVCVAPLSLQFAVHTELREQFDRVHELSSLRPNDNSLKRVLGLRDSNRLLTTVAFHEIAVRSGGLMRDLITLARDAGEEAYVSGSPRIELEHALSAVRQMGLSYSRGLSPKQRQMLRDSAENDSFDLTDPEMMFLVGSRRVVEYSSTSFALHPALSMALGVDAY